MVPQLLESPEAFFSLKLDLTGQRLVQRVNKALRRGVKRVMLHELADADGVKVAASPLGSAGSVVSGVSAFWPQAARLRHIAAESSMAISFFFMVLLLFI